MRSYLMALGIEIWKFVVNGYEAPTHITIAIQPLIP